MPPTIQTGEKGDRSRERKSRSGDKKSSDLACRVKYCNTLPDIPFDPKFITYPFESNRFVQYNPTSLERAYKHELLAEHDLGVTIDLINPDTYKIDPDAVLDSADEKLLEEDISTPSDSKRSKQHAKTVSWLRKTEYISTEYNRFSQSSEKVEARIGSGLRKKFAEEDLYKDRESQIQAIEKSFEDYKLPIEKHFSKPHVKPVEILPVFPDFENWAHPCAQVIFDADPAVGGKTSAQQVDEMSQAMIRGMIEEETREQFVGYFLPSEETMRKRKRDSDENMDYMNEETYEYKMAREYNWNVKNKATKGYEETYFVVFRPNEGAFYNELETRVRLSKRRAKGGTGSHLLVVKHREVNPGEVGQQSVRLAQLEPPAIEEHHAGANPHHAHQHQDTADKHSPLPGPFSGSEEEDDSESEKEEESDNDSEKEESESSEEEDRSLTKKMNLEEEAIFGSDSGDSSPESD